jgi:hypothetical protein
LHESTLLALNAALGIRDLKDADLSGLQQQLAGLDDLKQLDHVFMQTTLQFHQAAGDWKRAAEGGYLDQHFAGAYKSDMNWWWRAFNAGPLGWWDTNGAFASEQILLLAGDGSPEFWRSGAAALAAVQHKTQQAAGIHLFGNISLLNPRRFFGPAAIPNLINLWAGTAENLFRRRCAILTCALHRHRLKHGAFPASLTDLDAGLLPGPLADPARAEAPLNYRLTEKGFLLWSVGLDRMDDQGDPVKDWIWRHEPGVR